MPVEWGASGEEGCQNYDEAYSKGGRGGAQMLFDLLHISFILWQVLCSLAAMLGGRGVSKGKGIDCHICLSPFFDETFSTFII